MHWLKTVLREFFGLFVEDGSFAIAILLWLAVVGSVLPHAGVSGPWRGIVLFGGLGVILAASVWRYSRRRR